MKTALLKQVKWRRSFYQAAQSILASGLSDAMEYAVGARVLAGNGLTVIASIGNPAGQTILARSFRAASRRSDLPEAAFGCGNH
jgi:hypothetical protein